MSIKELDLVYICILPFNICWRNMLKNSSMFRIIRFIPFVFCHANLPLEADQIIGPLHLYSGVHIYSF